MTVRNGAVVDAPQALLLEDAPATVAVTDSEAIGRATFGGIDDSMTVDGGALSGPVAFGDGDDMPEVLGGGGYFTGTITGLEKFTGSGSQIYMDGVTFSGSSAAFTGDAELSIFGAFDLGEDGTMTIHGGWASAMPARSWTASSTTPPPPASTSPSDAPRPAPGPLVSWPRPLAWGPEL